MLFKGLTLRVSNHILCRIRVPKAVLDIIQKVPKYPYSARAFYPYLDIIVDERRIEDNPISCDDMYK